MTALSAKDALEIVERLLARTEQGALEWSVWDQGVYEYIAVSPRFRYYAKTRDNDGAAPYTLQIYRTLDPSSAGFVIDGAGDPPATEELDSYPESVYSGAIERLYIMARGKALGVDSLKSDILEDLGDD